MALVKKTPAAFEAQDDATVIDAETQTVVDAPANAAAAAEPIPTAQAKTAATTAIATASSTSLVAATGSKFSAALQDLKYNFSLEDVRSIGLAAPRITVDTGGFSKDGKDLGKSLTIQILSHNPRYLVSAGVNGDEGKELVRFSYDGVTIDGENTTLKDYVDYLKTQGYEKAAIKEYFDIWAIVTNGGDDAADIIGEMVVLQLSPQSAGQFKLFCIAQGVKIARGLAQPTDTVRVGVERVKFGTDQFGRCTFAAA